MATTMTDFDVEAERIFRAEIQQFLVEHPVDLFPTMHGDLGYGFGAWSTPFLRAAGKQGWIGLLWPAELGGSDLPPRALWTLLSELAYGRAPAEALFYSLAVGQCIVNYGSPELQQQLLPPLLAGEITFAEALSEPDAGSDLFSLRTSAREQGNSFIIQGQKMWTSNGATADYAMIVARTSLQQPGHRGISTFIVDLRDLRVERRPLLDANGEPSFSEIFFNDLEVPASWLLGQREGAIAQVLDALAWDRFWARSTKAPFLRRELEDLCMVSRSPLPSGEVLWDHEWVRLAVAEMATDIEVCDALCEETLPLYDSGRDTSAAFAAVKVFSDELGQRFYQLALEVLGLRAELPADAHSSFTDRVWLYAMAAHGVRIAGGTPEMQQSTMATRGLGLKASA
jgi:alkylation response protein AidB-like acyl-CoA dehydrogenase